jgi:hypothetical protein
MQERTVDSLFDPDKMIARLESFAGTCSAAHESHDLDRDVREILFKPVAEESIERYSLSREAKC